jgi:hypothetical protein
MAKGMTHKKDVKNQKRGVRNSKKPLPKGQGFLLGINTFLLYN